MCFLCFTSLLPISSILLSFFPRYPCSSPWLFVFFYHQVLIRLLFVVDNSASHHPHPSEYKQNTITFNIPLLPWLIVESSCQVCKTNPHTTYFHCIYSIAIPPPALIVDHYLFFYGLAWPQYEYEY